MTTATSDRMMATRAWTLTSLATCGLKLLTESRGSARPRAGQGVDLPAGQPAPNPHLDVLQRTGRVQVVDDDRQPAQEVADHVAEAQVRGGDQLVGNGPHTG